MNKNFYFLAIAYSTLFTLIFFIPYILNISKPLSLDHGDGYLINFIVNHVTKSLASGNLSQISNPPMFYGFQNNLFFSDSYLIQGILGLPILLFTQNPIIHFNILALVTIIFSFFSISLLTFHFTRNQLASLVGAIIFTFNPFVMIRFPDHLQFYSLQWIPLIILFFEKFLEKRNNLFIFLFFLFLTFQLLSSIYYSIFLAIILPIYALLRMYQEKIPLRVFPNKGFIFGLIVFSAVAFALGAIYYNVSKYSENRDVSQDEEKYISVWLTDLLFTGERNVLYGGLRDQAYRINPSLFHKSQNFEQSLFWGITPLMLFFFSILIVRKSPYSKLWTAFIIILILSLLLSLGSKVVISKEISFLGPYAVIKHIFPILNYTRVPARFMVFVFLSLAIISALTIHRISKLAPSKFKLIALFVIVLLIIEYWNRPPGTLLISSEIREFYKIVNEQKNIEVIANLPTGEKILTKPNGEVEFTNPDAHYLLWATILHNKKLINGYNGFEPEEYSSRVLFLALNYPISLKINSLKKWGAEGLILHKAEFNNPLEYDFLKNEITKLGVPVIVSMDNLVFFDLTRYK